MSIWQCSASRFVGYVDQTTSTGRIQAMFIAKLFVCGLLYGQCTTLADSKGLHLTERQCEARIREMAGDLKLLFPDIRLKAVGCQRLGYAV
jgi:hypothetical protein